MTTKQLTSIILGFTIVSCGSKEKTSNTSDQISGAYAREYSLKVTNPESGKEVGMRTIRDTIFIQLVEEGYEVSNRKWRLNDYDKEGWQSMQHSDDRPLPTYIGHFSDKDGSLRSESSELSPPIYVDLSMQVIFKTKSQQQPYRKIR